MTKQAESVLITGASGLVAGHLKHWLKEVGYEVRLLSTSLDAVEEGFQVFNWNPSKNQIDEKALQNLDYIVHLAGAGIADKAWTAKRKQVIIDSRVNSSKLLLETCKKLKSFPKGFVGASAIGYYNKNGNDVNVEGSSLGSGFLAESTKLWETSSLDWKAYCKVNILRIGMILDRKDGAFALMKKQFRQGMCVCIGNGKQMVSWVHVQDLCSMFTRAIQQNDLPEIVNAVAPKSVNMKDYCLKLATTLGKGLFPIKVPGVLMKLALGERSDLLLVSNEVRPMLLLEKGFKFKFKEMDSAIEDLCQ